jgi:hypothetical protein
VNAGSAHVFDTTNGALIHTLNNPAPTMGDNFGRSVSISGDHVVIGADGDDPGGVAAAGAAYLFDTVTGALLRTFTKPTPGASDFFGSSVGVSSRYVVVGVPRDNPGGVGDAGSAYLYDADSPAPPCLQLPATEQNRGIMAFLTRVRWRRRRRLMVRIYDVQTWVLRREVRCPFQRPAFGRIQVQAADGNYDGITDCVRVWAVRNLPRPVLRWRILPG